MTLRALAGKWVGTLDETDAAEPNARSFISAASATAPKPLAQRSSMSRRVRGRGVKRPQCMGFDARSVDEDKLLDVEQHVGQVRPRPHVLHSIVRGQPQRLALGVELSL